MFEAEIFKILLFATSEYFKIDFVTARLKSSIGRHPGGFSGNLQRIFSSGIRWRHSSGFSGNLQRIFSCGYF